MVMYIHETMFLCVHGVILWEVKIVIKGSCSGKQHAVPPQILLLYLFFNAVVDYLEVASTTTLSQRRPTMIRPLSATFMISRKLSPLITGNWLLIVV